ncbi:hypothetical protein HO173_008246 [Letharia columbiana]|uniref:Uncharacterized protein n=1 Tax=Letharia columbiana TaxID=112416 RepID=A0A8H6FRR1_9LECA|nr:uncharacterized protein HO173_008246 [Letharia columbiana]KAF6233515.1 hypothetical protein HO173_008246 [Letharia columbiana]
MENTAEKPSGNKATIVKNTAQLSKIPRHISYPLKEEQEEELQQANAENTAEKPSGNKAPSTKNTAQLSKIPRHISHPLSKCGEHYGEIKRQQGHHRQEHGSALQDPTSYQSSTQSATQLATQSDTLQEEEQEEELQQANAENTAEKPSGNKATIVKNTAQLSKIPRHMLSTVPHQIITQQAENTTATWPVVPTALIWARQEALQAKQTATQPAHQSTQSSTQPATQQEHSVKQEEEQYTAENITETVSSSSDTTALLSTISHQSTQSMQEKEPLQQAHAENTAEKPSDNKATIIKNTAQLSKIPRHMLSTVPRQITTQQAENDTTIWPAISACLDNITLWYITAMSTQEKDLLRRSQPSGPL